MNVLQQSPAAEFALRVLVLTWLQVRLVTCAYALHQVLAQASLEFGVHPVETEISIATQGSSMELAGIESKSYLIQFCVSSRQGSCNLLIVRILRDLK